MPPISFKHSAILLITALILVQGVSAITIEQAPLNPAFVAYIEGLDSDETDQSSIECYGDSSPTTNSDRMLYATGDIPAPIVMVWPDTGQKYAFRATAVDEETFPAKFDLRCEGRVTPARDQGKCGSCWAFAAYGSLESTYLTDTGTAENFSENNMNNLCSNLYPDGFDYAPCDGGNSMMSAAYLTRGSGPIREDDDPYVLPVPSNISPTDLPPVLDTHEVTFLPTRTGPLDNALLKQTLMDEGALRVRFLVNWSCFSDNDITYYHPDEGYPPLGGHAVTLVGWDDDFPKDAFTVEAPDDGAFILKNSWGTDSGEDGYFYLSYFDRSLDTGEPALFTGVPADGDRHIYQYDPLGFTSSIGTGTTTTYYGSNVFTAASYEELTDVSFYTREPETNYTVAIFTNFTTPPGDAAPVAWTSGTCVLPGYHTISLPDSVPLMPGDVFSIILEISSPTDTHPLVVEMPIEDYSSGALACPGESYVSEDGETWEDLTISHPNTNVCIKAFTQPLTVVPRDYTNIQEAVDAAASGDTIVVEAGTYPEELTVEKPITLLGVGMPVVATPADEIGLDCDADNITITGFTFDGGGVARGGIGILRNDCTISDIEITGYEDGLHIGFVNGLSVSDTAVYDNENNLEYADFQKNPGNTITETVTINGRPVVYRESVSGETIDASSDAGAVICVNGTDFVIRDTTTETIKDGYFLFGCQDITMENVTAGMVPYGVSVYESGNVTVQNSSFGPDVNIGMKLYQTSGVLAEGNEIACSDEGNGIELIDTTDTIISDNTVTGGMIGVLGILVINSTFAGNTIGDSAQLGIGVIMADHLAITNNIADVSVGGIITETVWNTLVSGNTVRCNDTGIGFAITSADGAEISANTAENCLIQAQMELSDSVVCKNHFSGAQYPVIETMDAGGDVFVYRNDFVLTDGILFGSYLSASAVADTIPAAEVVDIRAIARECGLCTDDTLPGDCSRTGDFRATGMLADAAAVAQQTDAADVTWHSPAEESYWYHGLGFTNVMGNYWSTYTGTDTTGDGIGDTPFVYQNETWDSYPLVKPVAWYADENPDAGGDNPTDDMATAGAMTAGASATFSFTGTAVQTVAITAAEETGRVLLTVDQAGSGPEGLDGTVYQYLSVQLSGMTDADIGEADVSFRVPAAWLSAEGLVPADIALWRYHDGAWQELPTSVICDEGGWVYFTATTPGFSTFAIAEGNGLNAMTDAIPEMMGPGPEIIHETADDAVSSATEPEPQVTVVIPDETDTTTPAADATTPQKSPIGLISLIGGAAGVALLFRRL